MTYPRCPNCNGQLKVTKLEGRWLCKKCNSMFEKDDWCRIGKEIK